MRKICYNNKDRMMAGMICGGWDPYEGGQVYEVPLGGTLMQQKFAVGGSGSTYIYGLVDATYKEGMTKEECKTFVKTGTSLLLVACCAVVKLRVRDGGSSGCLIVAQCLRLYLRH
jgi:20S proteasome subunit beta 1